MRTGVKETLLRSIASVIAPTIAPKLRHFYLTSQFWRHLWRDSPVWRKFNGKGGFMQVKCGWTYNSIKRLAAGLYKFLKETGYIDGSLSDTEFTKNIIQFIFISDLACNFSKVKKAAPDI